MKILHLTDSLSSGGKERQLLEVLKYFSNEKNIECEILVMSEDIHYDYINKLNLKKYIITRKFKKDITIFNKFYKIFKETKPDIIHSWNSMCSIYAIPASQLLDIRFVNGFLRDAPQRLNFKNAGWIRSKLTFPFSDIIIANSYAGLRSYNAPSYKSECLHNGFDFKRINDLESKETVKKELNIDTDFVVGMVASFSEKKDYTTFINAAHLILEKRKDVTFIAVGDGYFLESIKKMIKPEFRSHIKIMGKQKRVLNIVNIFDIGVLSTYTEGISNALMEYMALKKPVITTDCDGNRELVRHNQSGFLVEPQNPRQIEERISLILGNLELTKKLGENGYRKLKSEFNLEIMGKKLLNLYKSL